MPNLVKRKIINTSKKNYLYCLSILNINMENSNNPKNVLEALIDLYLNVKVRTPEEVDNCTHEQLEEERKALQGISPVLLIGYIKSSFEILLSLKEEDQGKKQAEAPTMESEEGYDEQLRKLEGESRMHIQVL